MTKISKVLKIGILSLLGAWCLSFGISSAQERGIGVSPANIEIAEQVDWPYTVPITVTNYSAEQEQFEVFFEHLNRMVVTALPGRFILESGDSERVFITFEEPKESISGLVKVLSLKRSADGLTTGTGVKIPFAIVKTESAKFLASASESSGGFGYVFGAGLLLVSLVLLWYIADIVRVWIPLEVPKKHRYFKRATEDADKPNF